MRRKLTYCGATAAAVLLAFFGQTDRAHAATFEVTRFDDPAGGVCQSGVSCSLRQAVIAANALAGKDTILLKAGRYRLTRAGAEEDAAATGDLDITSDLTIEAPEDALTIIDAKKARDRAFQVFSGDALTIKRVTIRGGSAGTSRTPASGGAILSHGTIELSRVVLMKNKATDDAGALSTRGTASLTNVWITKNKAGDDAGGLEHDEGTLTLERVTINKNKAAGSGGGLENEGTAVLTNVTISGNVSGGSGGGISNEPSGSMTLTNVTVALNKAKEDGGVSNPGGSVTLKNAIVAKNFPVDCDGIITAGPDSLDMDRSCGGADTGDPKLGRLQNNGPFTPTHALLPGSEAIDEGDDLRCPIQDQRGQARPVDGDGNGSVHCDVGAFEVQPAAARPARRGR